MITQVKKIAVKQREQKRKRVDSSSSSSGSSVSGSDSTISSGSSSVKNRVFCHRPHFQIGMRVCVACRFLLKPTWNYLESPGINLELPGIDLESPGIPGKNLEFHEKSEKPGITWNWIQILPMKNKKKISVPSPVFDASHPSSLQSSYTAARIHT